MTVLYLPLETPRLGRKKEAYQECLGVLRQSRSRVPMGVEEGHFVTLA